MALELRPNCEYCDKDLPPASTEAQICSYECTFCADCVDNILYNVCPNCGGGFVPRPSAFIYRIVKTTSPHTVVEAKTFRPLTDDGRDG